MSTATPTPQVAPPEDATRAPLITNVQVLRFVASAHVMVGHTYHEALRVDEGLPPNLWGLNWGWGVDIFFVISGFVMMHTSQHRFGAAGGTPRFWRARYLRVAPTYYIASLLMLGTILVLPDKVDHGDTSPIQILTSFLFIPWTDGEGSLRPLFRAGWTLNYEIFFYAMFGAILLFRRRTTGLAVLTTLFVGLALLHPFVPDDWWPLLGWTDPIILEFLFGIGVALLVRRGLRIPLWASAVLTVAGVVLWVVLPPVIEARQWSLGIPATFVLVAFVAGPQMRDRGRVVPFLMLLGSASYVLYLSHLYTVNGLFLAWEVVGGPWWSFVVVASLAAIAVSVVLYQWGEKPLLKFLHRRFGGGLPATVKD